MRIWGPRAHTCHFCGESSVLAPPYGARPAHVSTGQRISAGTPERWYCSVCLSWNVVSKNGEILDTWDREMWDESMNRPAQYRGTVPRDTLFCNVCLTNQTLVANMLAEYLPDESDASYAERERSLDAYRRALEQRYPIVCDACAPKVEERLAAVDARVRHQLLGAWMEKNAQLRAGKAEAQAAQFLAELRAWRTRRVLWAVSTAAGGLAAAAEAAGCRDSRVVALLVASCVPIRWDPTWRKVAVLATRGVPVAVRGVYAWRVRNC